MEIFLMRHGEADWNAASDFERRLTEGGQYKVDLNASQRKTSLQAVQQFFASPYLRAQETARIVADTVGYDGTILEADWITPDSDPQRAIENIGKLKRDSIMLFSHQPFSSAFVESLCGLERGYISMGTASIVAMQVDPVAAGLAELLWQHG